MVLGAKRPRVKNRGETTREGNNLGVKQLGSETSCYPQEYLWM